MSRTWSAVIPSNSAARLRRCLAALKQAHPYLTSDRIIVVDDGALAEWTAYDPPVTWLVGRTPFIYSRNVNLGIVEAGKNDVVIFGDDCEPKTSGCFDFAADHVEKTGEEAGAVFQSVLGPVGRKEQRAAFSGSDVVGTWNMEFAFVSVYIPRRTIEKVGLMDERFVGYGMEDADYCVRIIDANLKIFVDYRAVVLHNSSQEMASAWRSRSDIGEQHKKNLDIYNEKWRGTRHERRI